MSWAEPRHPFIRTATSLWHPRRCSMSNVLTLTRQSGMILYTETINSEFCSLLTSYYFWTFSLISYCLFNICDPCQVFRSPNWSGRLFPPFCPPDCHVKKICSFQLALTVTYLCCLTYFVEEQSQQLEKRVWKRRLPVAKRMNCGRLQLVNRPLTGHRVHSGCWHCYYLNRHGWA